MNCLTENLIQKITELEPFDLKKINMLKKVHPFYFIMDKIFGYWFDQGIYIIEEDDCEAEEFFCNKKYFKMLDNFYRYGIGFSEKLIHKNKLLIKEFEKNKCSFVSIYDYKYSSFGFPEVININEDKYIVILYPKVLCIDDIDSGEKELTEIEKWKRRVVCRQKLLKNKLTLVNPYICNNFLLFYSLSKSPEKIKKYHHLIRYYSTLEGIRFLGDKIFKNDHFFRYKDIKIYEDKLYKKFSKYLN